MNICNKKCQNSVTFCVADVTYMVGFTFDVHNAGPLEGIKYWVSTNLVVLKILDGQNH